MGLKEIQDLKANAGLPKPQKKYEMRIKYSIFN
jgi:hypothetical protein